MPTVTKTKQKKRSTVGLNKAGRIEWNDVINLICIRPAEERFHAWLIAQETGLSKGQVYERCKQLGVKLRDARNGIGERSQLVITTYSINTIKPKTEKELRRTIKTPAR